MAAFSTSGAHPFVTTFTPEAIETSEKNLKDIEVVYLHNNKDENNVEAIGDILVGLQKVKHSIKEFIDVKQCFTYIDERTNAKIYLILLNGLNENEMLVLKEYSQVVSIYQFDSSSPWIKDEVVPIHRNTFSLLLDQINMRHRLLHSDIAFRDSVEFIPQNDTVDSRLFIKYQLMMEIVLRLPVTRESKKDFIKWCLENYSTNSKDKEAIEKFDTTFTPDQAIVWYTKQSFVYRILGKTFASDDLRLIYKTRYFISSLYKQLKELQKETFEKYPSSIVVFRGKRMSRIEFFKFQATVDKLVITKCFLSTTLDKAVALMYSGEQEIKGNDVAVIFHMNINMMANKSKPFAFIQLRSTKYDEQEFLLAPGIIFLNKKIDKIKENMFIIELIHTGEEEEREGMIISSNTNYLDRAQNIESYTAFDLYIANASNPFNRQITPQSSGAQGLLSQTSSLTEQISPSTMKRVFREIMELRSSSVCHGPSAIFSIDDTPFDGDEDINPRPLYVSGRIRPSSNIYNQREYTIKITFPPSYPFNPPEVRFITPMYHPNISSNGMISLDILQRNDSWSSITSLTGVLQAVIDLIDHPNIYSAINTDAAREYLENRAEFDRKALETVQRHGLPRQ